MVTFLTPSLTLSVLLPQGRLPEQVNEIICGGRLIVLSKKDSEIRPISIGYTLHRLAAKCANKHVIKRRSSALQPTQIGVGLPRGAEVVIHETRRYIADMLTYYVIVKLDFTNAFISVRRDLVLDAAAANTPEIYRFAYAKYLCEPKLICGQHVIRSKEDSQQEDPSSLEFCDAVDSTIKDLNSEMHRRFKNDVSLSDHIPADVVTIIAAAEETGLHLNQNKCGIIANNFNTGSSICQGFRQIQTSTAGRPISHWSTPSQRRGRRYNIASEE